MKRSIAGEVAGTGWALRALWAGGWVAAACALAATLLVLSPVSGSQRPSSTTIHASISLWKCAASTLCVAAAGGLAGTAASLRDRAFMFVLALGGALQALNLAGDVRSDAGLSDPLFASAAALAVTVLIGPATGRRRWMWRVVPSALAMCAFHAVVHGLCDLREPASVLLPWGNPARQLASLAAPAGELNVFLHMILPLAVFSMGAVVPWTFAPPAAPARFPAVAAAVLGLVLIVSAPIAGRYAQWHRDGPYCHDFQKFTTGLLLGPGAPAIAEGVPTPVSGDLRTRFQSAVDANGVYAFHPLFQSRGARPMPPCPWEAYVLVRKGPIVRVQCSRHGMTQGLP